MAMRPDVFRRGFLIMMTSVVQWFFIRYYLLDDPSFTFTKYQRILMFSISSLAGGFAFFVGLLYIVIWGNDNRDESK
ncbi:MAG: hypothetical protein Q4D05_03500 [Acinetobacter sp.]|nr:hypothetical protein [Acinetobacter sp.]